MKELFALIKKFWNAEKSHKEHKRLQALLKEKEPDLKESLRASFKEGLEGKYIKEAEEVDYVQILVRIYEKQGAEPLNIPVTTRVVPIAKILAFTAASVILALSINMRLNQQVADTIQIPIAQIDEKPKITVVYNRTNQRQAFRLKDGSVAMLSPNTTLRYNPGFNTVHRMLILEGEANFKVRKNKKIPFIVSSNGFTTTALGTEFRINNHGADDIKLKLISGKVVVRSTPNSAFRIKDTYMKKGDELVINIRKKSSKVNAPPAKITNELPEKTISREVVPELYRFQNSKLSILFNQLKKDSHKNIVFDEADLVGMTFTGEFNRTDSIQFILKVICHTNELTIEESEKTIRIIKQ